MARAKPEPVDPQDAYQQLADLVRRIETENDERDAVSASIREIYAEAKGMGFEAKIIRKVIAKRRRDAAERREEEETIELYEEALDRAGSNVSGSRKKDPLKDEN